MARLLVVSRSMALAMRLADAHEVIEHPVEDIDHLVPPPGVDVVVLDVGEPAAAVHALDRLRGGGHETPALIVSGYQPAWASLVAIDVPDVVVVPLPITRAALLGGIAELCRGAASRDPSQGQGLAAVTAADPDRWAPDRPAPDRPVPEPTAAQGRTAADPAAQTVALSTALIAEAALHTGVSPAPSWHRLPDDPAAPGSGDPAASGPVLFVPPVPAVPAEPSNVPSADAGVMNGTAPDRPLAEQGMTDRAPLGWAELLAPPRPAIPPVARNGDGGHSSPGTYDRPAELAAVQPEPAAVQPEPAAVQPEPAAQPVPGPPPADGSDRAESPARPTAIQPAALRQLGGSSTGGQPGTRTATSADGELGVILSPEPADVSIARHPDRLSVDTAPEPEPDKEPDKEPDGAPGAAAEIAAPAPVDAGVTEEAETEDRLAETADAADTAETEDRLADTAETAPAPVPDHAQDAEPAVALVEARTDTWPDPEDEAPGPASAPTSAEADHEPVDGPAADVDPSGPAEQVDSDDAGWAAQDFDWWRPPGSGSAGPDPAEPADGLDLDGVAGVDDDDGVAADTDVEWPDLTDRSAIPAWRLPFEGVRPELIFDRPPPAWRPQTTAVENHAEPPVDLAPVARDRVVDPPELPHPAEVSLEEIATSIARRRALLGRTEQVAGSSALSRRLAGRVFETSLGPGGTSAELVALGLHSTLDAPRTGPGPVDPRGLSTRGVDQLSRAGPVGPAVAEGRSTVPSPPVVRQSATGPGDQPPHPPVEPLATGALVSELIDQIGQVYGVADTAQVLADEVVERADADAAAILVPDGAVWRVSGGVGLRPLERRLVLDASHWLVGEIAIEGRALLVEDTDIVRPKLVGAPLAAWRHLLAVPVPDVQAAVVLARGHEAGPFTEEDLAIIVGPVREAAGLLQAAIRARQLARLLAPLREQEPAGH